MMAASGIGQHPPGGHSRRSGGISGTTLALITSLAAHAAGILLVPSWQSTPAAAAPQPTTVRVRLELPAPRPVQAVRALPAPQQAVASRDRAAGPATPDRATHAAAHVHARAPAVLLAHREDPQPRPAVLEGPGQPAPEQPAARPSVGDQGASIAPPVAPAVREVLAFAANHGGDAGHTDVAYLHNPKPAYPTMARKLGLEGTVMLRILVNQDGQPEQTRLLGTSGIEVLDSAALDAVKQWRFSPARKGRVAIAHWVDVPITFKLGAQ